MIDIDKLKRSDRIARIDIARKVGAFFQNGVDSDSPKETLKVAQLLAEDTSLAVREALSCELRDCSFLAEELIETLVNDIDEISIPFLMASDAIDDKFMVDLIYRSEDTKQLAIAQRDGVCEAVAFAICDVAGRDVVSTLIDNKTAEVSARSCDRVVDRFPEDVTLLEALAKRADLPLEAVEKLIFKISNQYSERLMTKFNLAEDYASYVVSLATRRVFLNTMNASPTSEVLTYLHKLNEAEGLKGDQLLNFLQNKNLRLFYASLAVLTDRDFTVIQNVLAQGGKKVLIKLLDKAGVTKSVAGVLLVAYEREISE